MEKGYKKEKDFKTHFRSLSTKEQLELINSLCAKYDNLVNNGLDTPHNIGNAVSEFFVGLNY